MEQLALGAAALAVVMVLGLALSFRRVREGHEYAIERFGRFRRTLGPGAAFILPFAERVAARVSRGEQVLDVQGHAIVLADSLAVKVDATCAYQIVNVAKATYEVDNHVDALRAAFRGALSHALGTVGMERLLSERARLAEHIREAVELASDPWGIRITRIDLVAVTPPQTVTDAVAAQKKAGIDRDSARTRAEAGAEERLARAEAERRIAEMDAEAERLRVEKQAISRERTVEAEVRAALMLSQALDDNSRQALDYFIARQYVDVLGALARSEATTVLAMPTDALTGNLAGIMERRSPQPTAAPARSKVADDATPPVADDVDAAAALPFGLRSDNNSGAGGFSGGAGA